MISRTAAPPVDQSLVALASRQQGVVSCQQLRELGISSKVQLHRIGRGLWAWHLGAVVIDPLGVRSGKGPLNASKDPVAAARRDAWAMSLQLPTGAMVSGVTALVLRGCDTRQFMTRHGEASLPKIAIVPNQKHPTIPDVRIVRRAIAGRESHRTDVRRPVCTLHDALADILSVVPKALAEELLDHALQLRWLTAADFTTLVRGRSGRGRGGAGLLRLLARDVVDGTQSVAERRMARLLRRRSISGWRANYEFRSRVDGRKSIIDFAWPEARVAIEVDGRAHHSATGRFEGDRSRQNAISLTHWTILRFTWHQITRTPDRVVREIRLALAGALKL